MWDCWRFLLRDYQESNSSLPKAGEYQELPPILLQLHVKTHCSCCRIGTSSKLCWTSQAMRSSDEWKNTRWKPWMTLMKLSPVRVLLRFWPLLTFFPGNCVSGQIQIWTSASTIITLFSFCFLNCHKRRQTVSLWAMHTHSCLTPDIHTFDSNCQQRHLSLVDPLNTVSCTVTSESGNREYAVLFRSNWTLYLYPCLNVTDVSEDSFMWIQIKISI